MAHFPSPHDRIVLRPSGSGTMTKKRDILVDKIVRKAVAIAARNAAGYAAAAVIDAAGLMGIATLTNALVQAGYDYDDAKEIAELVAEVVEEVGGTAPAKVYIRKALKKAGVPSALISTLV